MCEAHASFRARHSPSETQLSIPTVEVNGSPYLSTNAGSSISPGSETQNLLRNVDGLSHVRDRHNPHAAFIFGNSSVDTSRCMPVYPSLNDNSATENTISAPDTIPNRHPQRFSESTTAPRQYSLQPWQYHSQQQQFQPLANISSNTGNNLSSSPFEAEGWHIVANTVSQHCLSRNGYRTPSSDSDTLSSFENAFYDCRTCVTKDCEIHRLQDELHLLRQSIEEQHICIRAQNEKVNELNLEMQRLQDAIKDQHKIVHTQQLCITQLEHGLPNVCVGKNRKRSSAFTDRSLNKAAKPSLEVNCMSPVIKRARFHPEQRKQTAETRKSGACVRCWKHKQRCAQGPETDGPCENCLVIATSIHSTHRLPCIRTHIVDLKIFRTSTGDNCTWTRRDEVEKVVDLSTYTSEERTSVVLGHGFGPELKVKLRPYRAVRDDVTEYSWKDNSGILQTWKMPAYALCDIDDLISSIKAYVSSNTSAYVKGFVKQENVPTWKALSIAQEIAASGESDLLTDVLQLWVAARLIEEPWQICGRETLGLKACNRWWWIPVTPIMDTQLDQIVIKKILTPLRKKVLHKLQSQVEKSCRKDWLEIIITIVILLNTIEIATRHDHEFATFFGHTDQHGRQRFEDYQLIESYFHSALTLLTHVKVAFDGRLPFLDEKTDVSKLMSGCHNGAEKDYMIEIDKYVSDMGKRSVFERMRQNHKYESQQFWVHQLFLKSWDGSPIAIKEDD